MERIKAKFDDCPYHCTNGKIMNTKSRKWELCPFCSERKKELARQGFAEAENDELYSLPTILGVDNEYLKDKYIYDSVVPDGERLYLDEDSVTRQKELTEEIYLGLTVGQLPSRSYCFGLGNKGRVDRFAYPMLAKAYLSGLSVAPFISCTEYSRVNLKMNDEVSVFFSSDLCMVLVNDGCTNGDLACVKGLMQTRAMKGKPTIFVTTWNIEACSILLGYWDEASYFLAAGCFVEYKISGKNKHSRYINMLTGVENKYESAETQEQLDRDFYGEPSVEKPKKEESKGVRLEELL